LNIELLHITPNAVEFIGKCAAICYDANLEKEACIRRATNCKNKGHLATMRFAHAVFNISGISRACSHQIVRSKHLDVLQRSQRYCKENDTTFIIPDSVGTYTTDVRDIYSDLLWHYNEMLKQGIKKEDARYILPEGTVTEMNVVGNLQAWQDFINLRATKEAQWEIRQVACGISKHLAYQLPELFEEVHYAE